MSVDVAARHAVSTLMSGPAAGVKAAAYTALAAGHRNIITCDMGGTSFDVGVIRDGRPALTADKEMGYGLPVRVPMIDIHTIGAGGGSIARVNSAGILQVGPGERGRRSRARSATGAAARSPPSPTPTCCSAGSTRPGCSASIGPRSSIASARSSTRRSARTWASAPTRWPARSCGWPTTRWPGAIRLVSLQRGHDPRDFVLFAFGGAGPLHAVALARELAIPRVLVPARPGHHLGARLPGGRRAPRLREDGQPGRAAPGPGRGAPHPGRRRWTRGGGCSPPRASRSRR